MSRLIENCLVHRSQRRAAAAVLALAMGCASASGLGDLDAYANHDAYRGSDPATVLRLLTGENLRIDAASSPPLGSIETLYDGEPGSLEGEGRGLLEFDGARVALTFAVADWRRPESFAFTAVEPIDAPAEAHLAFAPRGAPASRELPLSRTIVERRGKLARVEYATRSPLELPGGEVRLDYRVRGLSDARLGEFIVDGIGRRNAPPFPQVRVGTIDDWMRQRGTAECARVREGEPAVRGGRSRAMLHLLLGPLHESFPTRLVYWKRVPDRAQGYTTHSLILRVDDTGDLQIDFVRAWLVVPDAHGERMPLVILPQHGHVYGGIEAFGVLGESELAVGPELARHGVASLAYDSLPFGTLRVGYPYYYFRHYPDSGSTAKDLDNLRRLLDQVTAPDFQASAGISLDPRRVGIWGFSYGAWISMLAGVADDRIRAVAFSEFHYHDRDIAPGLSSTLFIPQLACTSATANVPLSVPKILREYQRPTFASVPDAGLLEEWTRNLDDPRIHVVVQPYGHVVTEAERAAVVDFFYRAFGIPAAATLVGVKHDLPTRPSQMAPYVERENAWRTALLKAMSGK